MRHINSIILILLLFCSSGCNKEKLVDEELSISYFLPRSGGANSEIIINGTGFSDSVTVTLNGKNLRIINYNEHAILARIPAGAGSGKLEISVNGKKVISTEEFTYIYKVTVSTLAGVVEEGFQNGPGTQARFILTAARAGLDVDDNLNVYVTDPGNHCIRKISPDGIVSTLAGNPGMKGYQDGVGTTALFQDPYDVACSNDGTVYVADRRNLKIRKITPDGVVTTFVDTDTVSGVAGSSAPYGIGINKRTGYLYYTEWNLNGGSICEVSPEGKARLIAQINKPGDIACDSNNDIYVTSNTDHVIYKIDFVTKVVSVFAGSGLMGLLDGDLTEARFDTPWGIATDLSDNIFVAGYGYGQYQESTNQCIRLINTQTRQVSTYAGSTSGQTGDQNGDVSIALFSGPTGVAVDKNGTVYVYDKNNNRIRKITKE